MSSDRKALLRGGSDGPGMRNLPLFGFLAGLVFFFYLFYVHQSQSAEYAIAQSALEDHKQQLRMLKLDLLNAKADNERLKISENTLKEERDKLAKEKDKCSVSLRNVEREKQNLKTEVSKKSSAYNDLSGKYDQVKTELEEFRKAIAAKEFAENQQKEAAAKTRDNAENAKETGPNLDASAQKNTHSQNQGNAKENPDHYDYEAGGAAGGRKQRRNFQIGEGAARTMERKEDQQAPAPVPLNVGEDHKEVVKKSVEAEPENKEEMQAQVGQPPQHQGDQNEQAAGADEQQGQEHVVDKPVVRGGDYEDKLDVEKGIGDDVQPA